MAVFYRRVDVVGVERVPREGPLVVAANHQNALVDPMLVMAALPRRLVPIAKTPLFRHPLIGPFLRLAGAVPVQRPQDLAGAAPDNAAMFAEAARTLAAGGAILIFPEGTSQPEPALMPLRTGAARMLVAAWSAHGARVSLLPVGLVLEAPGSFREGRATVVVGDPVRVADLLAPGTSPEAAVREITERLATALRRLMVEAGDRETLRLLHLVDEIWRLESTDAEPGAAGRLARLHRAVRAHERLRAVAPDRIERLRADLERYAADLDALRLSGRALARAYPFRAVLRFALREALSLLAGLPGLAVGLVIHGAPYQLTALAARALGPAPDEEATYKIAAGLALYPLCWALEAWMARRLGGLADLVIFLLALPPAVLFALSWRARLARVARQTRAYLTFLRRRDLHLDLLERRRALRNELEALDALASSP
ncbi:MAG: 1-acyl-sn-glycerol-3-phosphate acyltransferase [Candidatus Rokubacteria bacterium]|nr:1-acyl-sn-glycerol-3-phosphate acyltransferase [Candidatus Rokubacteria bacterium]